MSINNIENLQIAINLSKENKSYIIATLIDKTGSAPQELGAKIFITEEGRHYGTIGGGKIEAYVIKKAIRSLESLKNKNDDSFSSSNIKIIKLDLKKDVGMTCGGNVTIFFETFLSSTSWELSIFGAGHISQALIPIISKLDCQINIYDHREEWLNKFTILKNNLGMDLSKFSNIKTYHLKNYEKINYIKNSWVLCISQGYKTDFLILKSILKENNPPFIGVIGSLEKWNNLKTNLLKEKIPKTKINKIHCPIGLTINNQKIGRNTPQEIAISISAQLIYQRDRL